MTNLDVALRIRFLKVGDGAKAVEKDLKGLKDVALQLGKTGGTAKLGEEIAKIGVEAKRSNRELVDMRRAMTRIGSEKIGRPVIGELGRIGRAARDVQSDLLKVRLDRLGHDIAAAQSKFVSLRGEAKATRTEVEALAGSAQRLSLVDRFRNRVDQLGHRTPQKPAGPTASPERPSAGGGIGPGTAGAGAAALGLGSRVVAPLGVAYTGKKAFDQSVTVDAAWAEVLKKVNDASPEQFVELEKSIRQVSLDLGIGRAKLMGLVAEAGAAGIAFKDLMEFMQLTGKSAVGWDMDPREASEKLANTKAATGKTLAEMAVLADKINALGDNSAAKERDILDMFLRVGPAAKEAGVDENSTLAMLTGVRSGGMEPEVVARWFGAFTGGLRTAELAPPRVEAGLQKIGLTSAKVVEGMKTDSLATILDLFDRLQKSPDAAEVATQIFGREWWDETLRVKGGLAEITKQIEFLRKPSNYEGSLEKGLAIQLATAKSHLEKMNELVSRIGEGMTRWSLGPFNSAIDAAVAKVHEFENRAGWVDRWMAEEKARLEVKGELMPAGGQVQGPPAPAGYDGAPEWIKQVRRTVYGDERTADVVFSEWLFGKAGAKDKDMAAAQRKGALAGVRSLVKEQSARESDYQAAERSRATAAGSATTTPYGYQSGLAARDQAATEARAATAKARLDDVNARLASALKSPQLEAIAKADMDRFSAALNAEGMKAVEIAQRIAAAIAAALSLTARPTIAPQGPGATGAGAGAGVGKQSSLGGPTIHQHITGADPARVARAAQREQDRAIRSARAGALHDLGSWS